MTNDECWEKFKFRLTLTQKHPIYSAEFTLDGLAADAFSRMERQLDAWKEAYERLSQKYDHMTHQEMYRLRDEVKKKEFEK